ncbi:LexA family transcriptional regulator [Bacillus thuringiensis]|uniref:Helix-turn-helix domain-containing protein n=1 Tax=Bacillus thuringiensis serovar andalousiensis TaxID=257985 RepID=A0A6H0TF49_BACTU|nr:S24 family peptidase [Bacillus thuringiensis]QIW18560.1 helix-turn-helix domain-containing protein [Bacillus thuringiensis serovar andalousiensis]
MWLNRIERGEHITMFLDRLKKAKLQSGLTTEEISNKSGVPIGTLNKIFNGTTKEPKFPTMLAISEVLDCTLEYLAFGDVSKPDVIDYQESLVLSEKEQDHIKKYRTLDERGKESVDVILDKEYKHTLQNIKNNIYSINEISASDEDEEKYFEFPLLGCTAAGIPLAYGDENKETITVTDVPNEADFALMVKGDSMEPLIEDGSIIFLKEQHTVESGEIAIIEIDRDEVTCKKVYWLDNHNIELRSLNKKYPPTHPNEWRIIGKVILD